MKHTRCSLLLVLLALACGRTSPDPCRAPEGLACDALAQERQLTQSDYDAAVALGDGNILRREAACVQSLVAEQIEQRCIKDPCVELCTLHPCALTGAAAEPADCATRCAEVVADNDIASAALDAAILRAANDPTLCSCAICDEGSAALCEQLWVCPSAP